MKRYDYIITGCGLSGLMLAYRMSKDSYFDARTILLIDSEKKNSNDRTWSFWEKRKGDWDHLVHASWKNAKVSGKKFSNKFSLEKYTYKTIRSSQFYQYIWKELEKKENFTVLQDTVLNISHRSEYASVLAKSGEYVAKKLFNSILLDRRYNQQAKYPVLQQHFLGWFIETEEPAFDENTVTFMDFSVEQRKRTRFMYILPFSSNKALVEYTLFSQKLLPEYEYTDELKLYLRERGIKKYKILEVEKGSIPMTSYRFWKQNSSNVLYIGTSGGWTKASTGYTFSTTNKKTKDLVEFIKEESDLKKFRKKNRFWFYDLVFLDVLSEYNDKGSKLFVKLFKRNKPLKILQFLDEETHFLDELKIMFSMTSFSFLKAIVKRIRP